MSEEEKKAIEKALWYFQEVLIRKDDIDQWAVIVNFIEKQQEEIEGKTTILFAGAEKVKQLEKEITLKQIEIYGEKKFEE